MNTFDRLPSQNGS